MTAEATMSETNAYKYLGPRLGSSYRQYFINGTRIRARVICGAVGGEDGRTPEQVADDYDLPLEVVLECIKYCDENPDVLRQDWEDEEALYRSRQWPKPSPRAETPAE
jgi:uncharacterized protein (DUF433 family)